MNHSLNANGGRFSEPTTRSTHLFEKFLTHTSPFPETLEFDSRRTSAKDFDNCEAYTTHKVLLIFEAAAKRLMTKLSNGTLELPYHGITESTLKELAA